MCRFILQQSKEQTSLKFFENLRTPSLNQNLPVHKKLFLLGLDSGVRFISKPDSSCINKQTMHLIFLDFLPSFKPSLIRLLSFITQWHTKQVKRLGSKLIKDFINWHTNRDKLLDIENYAT